MTLLRTVRTCCDPLDSFTPPSSTFLHLLPYLLPVLRPTGSLRLTPAAARQNCPLSEHAEEFLLRDPALLDAIRKIPISMSHHPRGSSSSRTHRTLTLYQRLQPCHRSSDNRDGWSCSEALVENLWRRELLPRGISLDVAVSYTYRAHWDVSGMKPRDRAWFGPAVEAARRGIRVFANATGTGTGTGTEETGKEEGHSSVVGVRLRALREEDWKFLVSLCDDDVQEDYRRVFDATSSSSHDNDDNDDNDNDNDDDDRNRNGRKAVGGGGVGGDQGFTSAIARHRRAMDAFVEAQIRLHSSSSSSSSSLSSLSLSVAEDSTEGKEPKTFAEKMRLKRLAAGGAHTTGSDGHNHGHGGASSASASESGQAAASFRNGRSGDGDWCDNRRWSKGGGKGGDRGGGYERGGDRGGGRRGVPASGGAASETRSREW